MHELSIAQSILSIVENAAPQNPDATITSVKLQIGELSGIELEALKFALSITKNDTILKDAEFDIEIVRGEAECPHCKTVFPMHYYGASCPSCNNYFITVLKGREMKVLNIVVDEHAEVEHA
jgi:hydrogenase nickel incorporation protein HypA/HybF